MGSQMKRKLWLEWWNGSRQLRIGPRSIHTMQDTTFTTSIKCIFIIDSLSGTKARHWRGCHLCLFVLYTDEVIPSRMPVFARVKPQGHWWERKDHTHKVKDTKVTAVRDINLRLFFCFQSACYENPLLTLHLFQAFPDSFGYPSGSNDTVI